MLSADYRRVMSLSEFDRLAINEEYPIVSYYEALIGENDRLGREGYVQSERFQDLSDGQRMLIQIAEFDGQLKNGGITQFFWNFAENMPGVSRCIELLGQSELLAHYHRACETLTSNQSRWSKLRVEDNYEEACNLLDLEWFDGLYFDGYGYNEQGEWGLRSIGLQHGLALQVVDYIRDHTNEFIVEPVPAEPGDAPG